MGGMVKDAEGRVRLIKAADALVALSKEPEDKWFQGAGAIKPPYDPTLLAEIFEDSNILRQCVEAYSTNIDGFGYTLEPLIDFYSEDGRWAVESALSREREGGKVDPKEVDARIEQYEHEAESERVLLHKFLDYASIGISFTALRKRTRQDLEVTGNAYWEVVRDAGGKIAKLVYVPAYSVRLMPLNRDPVVVAETQRVGPMVFEPRDVQRQFRTYVQRLFSTHLPSTDDANVFFREFGDPRTVSPKDGRFYPSLEALQEADGPDARPANEIIHFAIHSPSSAYGVPRWIGNLASVLGSREMETVNYNYFQNKGVPPLAILVAGGVLTEPAIARIEQVINEEIKGTENWHKVLVIEATSEEGSSHAPKVQMVPLMESVLKDGIFQSYDERNIDKVASSFRVPRLLRGDVRDFNRATAYASIRFAEEQVFAGEREDFDFTFNRTVLLDMGIKHWYFRSMGPKIRDPETIMNLAVDAAKAAAVTPNEVRAIMSKALGVELPRIEEEWANRPPSFTLAGRGFTPTGVDSEVVTEARAAALSDRAEKLQKEITSLVLKVQEGIEDEQVRAFKAEVARMSGMEMPDNDAAHQGQKTRPEDGEGAGDPGGAARS